MIDRSHHDTCTGRYTARLLGEAWRRTDGQVAWSMTVVRRRPHREHGRQQGRLGRWSWPYVALCGTPSTERRMPSCSTAARQRISDALVLGDPEELIPGAGLAMLTAGIPQCGRCFQHLVEVGGFITGLGSFRARGRPEKCRTHAAPRHIPCEVLSVTPSQAGRPTLNQGTLAP